MKSVSRFFAGLSGTESSRQDWGLILDKIWTGLCRIFGRKLHNSTKPSLIDGRSCFEKSFLLF